MDRLSLHCERADCGAIQAFPGDVTYFELMGIGEDDGTRNQPTYDIDMGELRRNFLTLQQRVHPDGYSQKDQKEYAYAQQQSSMINKAYQTLRDPIERSLYMLELNNVTIDEAESVDDPELLMEVLEAREQLEGASNEDEAKVVQDGSEARMNSLVEDISKAFKNKDYPLAKKLTIQLRYWNNIRNAARY
ncbi:4387_t:CDS:2 [Paraglomus brasilianum]|uniref:4387_t:CDS:1 n=1 Tax=Paraglomus brasilianum TaxID=144538 RepID=A0A9N8ZEX6_9GLOM|nr:4387_t:CDS:2 [Paraglomus brasilianum]